MKKISIALIIVLATTLLITGCDKKSSKKDNEEITKTNTNENVVKDQIVDELQFTKTSLTTTNGISTLVTEVTNNTGEDYNLVEFIITAKDENGKVLATFPGYVGEVIENGTSKTIDSSIDIDLSEAASVEYSVEK